MEQDRIYYIVIDENPTGPFTLDEITLNSALNPESLVWKPGLDNWVAAKTLPELAPAFHNTFRQQTPPEFSSSFESKDYQHTHRQEYNEPNRFGNNPQYNPHHSYHHQGHYNPGNPYRDGYRPAFHTNWLPWAIVATIVGFFASCIGAIFGIIGIVQANKANSMYARGFDSEGDAANSNAKIMTIIGLIFAGIGILVALWFGSIFSSLGSYSSF